MSEKIGIIWRCSSCEQPHLRKMKQATWDKADVQSPCPKCTKRTRINAGNARVYSDIEEAQEALLLLRGQFL